MVLVVLGMVLVVFLVVLVVPLDVVVVLLVLGTGGLVSNCQVS